MKEGELCRVIINGHNNFQLGDIILITRMVGISYVEGFNTRTGNRHHYLKEKLEKL
jgi:hypothetical protein